LVVVTPLDEITEMRRSDEEPTRPPYGELGSLTRAGDRLQCHLCGRFYVSLAAHVVQGHGMRADEYRETFGLNATTALVGPSLQAVRRATGLRVLTPYQDHRRFVDLSPEERSAQERGREVRLETRRALAASKQRQVAVACAICGKAFTIKASRARRPERHTCSQGCRRELLRRDGVQAASTDATKQNLGQGTIARWEGRKSAIATRLRVLDEGMVNTLTDRDRTIVETYYGLSGAAERTQLDIAQRLGLSSKTVHRRLHAVVTSLLGPNAFDVANEPSRVPLDEE
jgi:hypothetical protein